MIVVVLVDVGIGYCVYEFFGIGGFDYVVIGIEFVVLVDVVLVVGWREYYYWNVWGGGIGFDDFEEIVVVY